MIESTYSKKDNTLRVYTTNKDKVELTHSGGLTTIVEHTDDVIVVSIVDKNNVVRHSYTCVIE
jgi:hypothetical protein